MRWRRVRVRRTTHLNRRWNMDRRKFLTDCVAGAATSAIASSLFDSSARARTETGKHNIQYVREKVPEFEIAPYRGERYQDSVPDTLDIAELSKLAIHALTSITDPEADDEIFW